MGTFAVQIAKALGAEVTAVCSTRNVEQARSLGADHVIDYTREDFTRSGRRYDVLLDVAGSKSWSQCRRVLNPHATLVLVGGPKDRLLGPLGHIAKVKLAALRGSQRAVFFIAKFNRPDMAVLRELLESEQVKPVVEKRYELGEVANALRYMGEGHARKDRHQRLRNYRRVDSAQHGSVECCASRPVYGSAIGFAGRPVARAGRPA